MIRKICFNIKSFRFADFITFFKNIVMLKMPALMMMSSLA